MKKKILASVLAAVMLSGCTMPDVSFEDTGSPLFVENGDESVTSSSGAVVTDEDSKAADSKADDSSASAAGDMSDKSEEKPSDDSAAVPVTDAEESVPGTDSGLSGDASKEENASEKKPAVKEENAEPLAVVLAKGGERRYDNASGTVSAEVNYIWPELAASAKKESPELNKYLNRYEIALMKQMNADFSELADGSAKNSASESTARTIERTTLPVRSDTLVFSAVTFVSGDKEKKSGIEIETMNIDSRTGREIELSEVINTEEIADLLTGTYTSDYADEPIADFEKMLAGTDASDYVWAVSEEGVNFYFADDTGTKPVTVQLLRSAEPDLFTDSYAGISKSASLPLKEGVEYAFDIKDDGQTDLLSVTGSENSITVEMNGKSAVGRLYSSEIIPVLVRTADERYYIYVNSSTEEEDVQFVVFDMNGEIPVFLGTIPGTGFPGSYDDDGTRRTVLPADTDEYLLASDFALLSSYSGSCLYRTGNDGMPEKKDTWYYLSGEDYQGSDVELTVLMKFAADSIDPQTDEVSEEGIIVQKGKKLKIYRTDGNSIVDLKTEDDKIIRVDVDTSGGWPQTIDGTDIQKLFDGIRFAN